MPIPVDWSIRNLDTGDLFIPQFPMDDDGLTYTVGGVIVDVQRFAQQHTVAQWVGGGQRTYTFRCLLFTRFADEAGDVEEMLDTLVTLTEEDEGYGRPPICQFRHGNYLSDTVMVERVDPNVRRTDMDGFAQEIHLPITLRRYTPFTQQAIDPTKPAKESYHRSVSATEQMWEQMARAYYGDPMLGDRLRKRHPQYPFAPPLGTIVNIPARSIVLKEEVRPGFHAFDPDDEDAMANYERILADRSARTIVEVV